MNILVTEPNYKQTLGLVRQLGKDGYSPYLLTYKRFSLAGLSKYAKAELLINRDYTFNQLLQLLKKYQIELIIPVGTESIKKLTPWKYQLIENGVDIIVPDYETVQLALSKKQTYQIAQQLGIPYPKTFYPQTINDILEQKFDIKFPVVIKGLYEIGGHIVDYAYDYEDLKQKYIALCKKHNLSEGNLPMLQEYISGFGCGFFAVYDNGRCGPTFQHKRIREYPVSGGASVCAESYKNELLEKYGRKLLDHLKWHGMAMVEFKMGADNIPYLMEINPKFWGSLDIALEAGVNFPKAIIDIHNGKKLEFSRDYKYPFRYHWPLHGDLNHAIENPKNFFNVLKDCLNPKVKSNIWLSDFKPTLKMLYTFSKSFVKSIWIVLNKIFKTKSRR